MQWNFKVEILKLFHSSSIKCSICLKCQSQMMFDVCPQVMAHGTPQGILDDVAMVSLLFQSVFKLYFHDFPLWTLSPRLLRCWMKRPRSSSLKCGGYWFTKLKPRRSASGNEQAHELCFLLPAWAGQLI